MSRHDSYLRYCDGMIKIPINDVIAWQSVDEIVLFLKSS